MWINAEKLKLEDKINLCLELITFLSLCKNEKVTLNILKRNGLEVE